jgi:5-methylcytosine-specific restriction endonuclease McrA
MAKKVFEKVDGLGPKDIKNLRSAIRLVWQRSHVRKLVVNRCTGKDGFAHCELCKKKTPALKIDHINKVGDLLDPGYISRMFTPSKNLQGLCKKCHDAKTKEERAAQKKIKKAPAKAKRLKKSIEDFY